MELIIFIQIFKGLSNLVGRGRKNSTDNDKGDVTGLDDSRHDSPERLPYSSKVTKKRISMSNLLGRGRKNSTDNDKVDLSSLDNSPERVPPFISANKKRTSITGGLSRLVGKGQKKSTDNDKVDLSSLDGGSRDDSQVPVPPKAKGRLSITGGDKRKCIYIFI
jgi:hypothetical protein